MPYDFDTIIDRTNTDSLKYDFAERRGMPKDILPLWVADMDFRTPPEIIKAMQARIAHGIFGYTETGEAYAEVLRRWLLDNFNWEIRPEWLIKTPGVVFALATAVRCLTQRGDAVIIQQPVYYPFTKVVKINDRKLVINCLHYEDGQYTIDFDDFEKKIVENKVKLFILCNPHNPVGRVWTRDELLRLGEICLRHNVLVAADEIHADFVYEGHTHLVFANISPDLADITVTCTAPTKTFNLAGLHISNIFIANETLRRRFRKELDRAGYSQPNIMGIVAGQAAYEKGGPWLRELRAYLQANLDFTRTYLQSHIPQIRLIEPEGTYLIWLDCRSLGLSDRELNRLIVEKAGLWLDSGTMFGCGGEGFQRINIACPRKTLALALEKLAAAITSLGC